MALVTRQGKGSKLTVQEMDGNLTYLEGGALSRNPILRSFQYAGKDADRWIELMSDGIIFSSEDVDGPDDRFYGLASIETWNKIFSTPDGYFIDDDEYWYRGLKDMETFMSVNKIKTIPTNYFACVETYAKTGDQVEGLSGFQPYNQPIRNTNSEANLSAINQVFQAPGSDSQNSIPQLAISAMKYSPHFSGLHEVYDRLFDKGIIEKGRIAGASQISLSWDLFFKSGGLYWPTFPAETFDRVLDWGIFIVDFEKGGRFGLHEETSGTQKPRGVFIGNFRGLRNRVISSSISVPA